MQTFDINAIIQALPLIEQGILTTIIISITSSIFAFIIGLSITYLKYCENKPISVICNCYVEIIRNTPLLIQIYIYYKGLPDFGIQMPPMICGILALSLYTGAFISEVLRSGLNAVPIQQSQAAKSLGLSKFKTFHLIIFPQAIKIVIPPLGSQFINLIKNSSLVSFISVVDVFYVVYKQSVDDFRFLEFFITGALIYMVLTGIVAVTTNILEHKCKLPTRRAVI